MKNRFCRTGKTLLGAVCLLSMCGVTYSCSDDYDLDETSPSFLGASIYDELKNRTDRKFSYVIKLIDDLDYTDVMSKTGSKTLFVADDDAYERFFATTEWTDGYGNPVRSYDQLSTSQKRWLLNGSMLNNAYVLEMMTTIQGPVKNLCLRQLSAIAATDTVPYFKWDELPENLNEGIASDGTSTSKDKRFWDRYRTQAYGGMYLALDKTEPMLTHFLQAQLNEKSIEPSDVSFILGLDGTSKEWNDQSNRSFVYTAEITEPDVTCLNGYYHVLDTVLVTPPNMAEMIRQNGTSAKYASDPSSSTMYFSQMLDRFSAPYYDATLTEEYKALHTITADSIFQKLYISQRNQTGSAITTDPDGEPLTGYASLSYDPGWNTYYVNSSTKEQDMGAMFVPSDEAMKAYFLEGGGAAMIETYGTRANTEENLEFNLYQIPLDIVQKLVANLMKESFNSTVPSKYRTIMNSAQDQMFSAADYPSVADYKAAIKKVMLANNGVVYVLKDIVTPPDYAAVSYPVLASKSTRVMNAVIHADDNYLRANYTSAPLRKYYSTYLTAMQSNFTLFAPTDEGLTNYGYMDPMSFASGNSANYRYWTMAYAEITSSGSKQINVRTDGYAYTRGQAMNPATDFKLGTGYISQANDNLESASWGPTKKQMLTDMVDHHIIVHDDTEEAGIDGTKHYYIARSGAPVYVKSFGTDLSVGTGMVVDGGLQLQFNTDNTEGNDFDCSVTAGYDLSQGYGNGHTFFLDRPMQATLNNVYQILQANEEYTTFFETCRVLNGSESSLLETIFRTEDMDDSDWNTQQQKYNIFSVNGTDQSLGARLTANNTNLVRFFNNYRYTIFVPDNDAMQAAFDRGLPTIDDIQQFVDHNTVDEELPEAAKKQAQAMVTCLVNFLKYHFCDLSYFADIYDDSDFTETQSACSEENGNFITLGIKHVNGGLQVRDQRNEVLNVQAPMNLMARDYELDAEGSAARSINSSSYVAIHGLDGYLLFDPDLSESFATAWQTNAKAKAFVKKFPLKK